MASEKILEQKKKMAAEINEKITASCAGVLVDYKGITVSQDTALRKKLRESNVDYFVVKNNVLRFALKDTGFEDLESVLNGTTSIALSNDDAVAPAKIISDFASENKEYFNIKGGFVEGKIVDLAEIDALAKMPSREGLLSMLCSALQGNISGLARALKAVADKKAEGADAAPAAEAPAEAPAAAEAEPVPAEAPAAEVPAAE